MNLELISDNARANQLLIEQHYSKGNKRRFLHKVFGGVAEQLPKDMNQDDKWLAVELLAILGERQSIMLNTIVEMTMEKDELYDSVNHILDVCIRLMKLGHIYYVELEDNVKFLSRYVLTDDESKQLKSYRTLPPMLVKPDINHGSEFNRGSGYLTRSEDSLIMGNPHINHHEHDISVSVLEKFNATEFQLNQSVILYGKDAKPKRKSTDSNEDYQKKLDAHKKFAVDSHEMLEIMDDNTFYFTHKYDKRGRLYPVGYYINYQGNDFAKASVELVNQDVLTETVEFFS